MESTGYRHLRSPSGDRFLGVFSFSPPPASVSVVAGDELNEDEVCFSDDFTDPQKARHRRSTSSSTSNDSAVAIKNRHRQHWLLLSRQLQSSGILAALPGGATPSNIVIPSMSPSPPSRPIPPAIPKKSPQDQERELPQSAPHRKFQQSAPVSVPVLSPAMWKQHKNRFFEADDDSEDEEMLPPHEIVARGSGASPRTTFSVLEGAGRTLKGRDLRQVRNAIWRKTGFLD